MSNDTGLKPPRIEPSNVSLEASTLPPLPDAMKRAIQGWLRLLQVDRNFSEALDALTSCANNLWIKQALTTILPLLACLAVPRKGAGLKKTFESLWASDTGKTWKALKEFSARLRRMAQEIEAVNRSQFLSPALWIKKDESRGRFVEQQFRILPGALRIYAAWLDMLLNEKLPAAWEHHVPSPKRGHSPALFHLSDMVKAATGRFHDREVCDLLTAAATALDAPYNFDPTLLAQARARNARKRSGA